MRTHPGRSRRAAAGSPHLGHEFLPRPRRLRRPGGADLPRSSSAKGANDAVRVWTAACATGEEAYSVAMLLLEQAGTLDSPPSIQVFATDLAEDVIAAARDGLFP